MKRRELPLYDRIALRGSDKFYEETSDPEVEHPVKEELSPPSLPSSRPRMADIPSWAMDIMKAQQAQIAQQKAALEQHQERMDRITQILEKFELP